MWNSIHPILNPLFLVTSKIITVVQLLKTNECCLYQTTQMIFTMNNARKTNLSITVCSNQFCFVFYVERRVLTAVPSREIIVRCLSNSSRKYLKNKRWSSLFFILSVNEKWTYSYFTLHFNKSLSICIDIFYRFVSYLTGLNKSNRFQRNSMRKTKIFLLDARILERSAIHRDLLNMD